MNRRKNGGLIANEPIYFFKKCGIYSFFYLADNKSKENKNLKIGMTESSSYFGTSKIFPLEFSFNARRDSLKSE